MKTKNYKDQRLINKKKMENKKGIDHLDNGENLTSQLQQIEENINFISSSGNNSNHDEHLTVVGILRTKHTQKEIGHLIGK